MTQPRPTTPRPADVLRRPPLFDIVVTAALTVAGIVLVFLPADDGVDYLPGDFLGVVIVVACTLPLLLRRSAPVWASLIAAGVIGSFAIWTYSLPLSIVIMMILVYSAAAYGTVSGGILVAVLFLGLASAYSFWLQAVDPGIDDSFVAGNLIFSAVGFGGMWALGRAIRGRRLYTLALEDRADRLQRTRDAEVRAALAEERSRIARELHDVVAHHVSVMTVQASGARRLLDRDPERSAEAMAAIESTGRAALTEMRRVVGVLRGPSGIGDSSPDRAPQRGLADLDTLADQFGQAGLAVQIEVDGVPARLPVGVDVTAYRIVQEALTNTIKHAGPATASVHVEHRPGEVTIRVSDDGRGLAAALDGRQPGHGLLGMRERVALYGGTLAVGPRRDGGFEVRARIPFDDTRIPFDGSSDPTTAG